MFYSVPCSFWKPGVVTGAGWRLTFCIIVFAAVSGCKSILWKVTRKDLEHLPGDTLALIQSCDLVIIVHVPIGLCIMLCSSGSLSRQGSFGLIACYTTHSADALDWITLGKPPCCTEREAAFMFKMSCSLKDRLLDPAGKFISSH